MHLIYIVLYSLTTHRLFLRTLKTFDSLQLGQSEQIATNALVG
jgi:hypothetical protein